MANSLQFSPILLLLLTTISATQATIVPKKFKNLQVGHSITGTVGAELRTRSKIQCSDRCSSDNDCMAYQYKVTPMVNCFLIHANSTATEGQMFESDDNSTLYEKVFSHETRDTTTSNYVDVTTSPVEPDGKWTSPQGWTGPDPALYISFDYQNNLVFMEGSQQKNYDTITLGKVKNAWKFDRLKRQWADLGIHTEVCMTRPETCGAAGGAISLWMRVIDCPSTGGIVSSFTPKKSGTSIKCGRDNLSLRIDPAGRFDFFALVPTPSGWVHFILNYIGPHAGFTVHIDGEVIDTTAHNITGFDRSPGEGRIVIARETPDKDVHYASVVVDELLYFNTSLSSEMITILYGAT